MKNISLLFALGCSLLLASCARPVAKFSTQSETIKAPTKVQFENQSQKAETYEWDFGDGNFSTAESPEHRYVTSGNYKVILKAKKGNKVTKTSKQVFVGPPDRCLVEIETNYGTMIVWLYDATPNHRDNFTKLVDEGFYQDLLFHRVINGFMIQGGDPESRGADEKKRLGGGGPGYQIDAEFVDSLVHVKGALAAARTNNPQKRSSGSQFYIVHGKATTKAELETLAARKNKRYSQEQIDAYLEHGGTPFLDRDYVVFGQVIEGLDVIDQIAGVQTMPGDRPKEDVWMKMRVIK